MGWCGWESELGAIWNHTEWWVERGLQRLGGLGGSNLASNAPEIVLANAHLLDDRLKQLSGKVRDIHELAQSNLLPQRHIGTRDDPSHALHFTGAPLPQKSSHFEDHFPSLEVRAMALQALYAQSRTGVILSSTNNIEVLVFSSASIGGEQVTSLAYTRSTERCAYNVILQVPVYNKDTLDNIIDRCHTQFETKYATVVRFYLVRHKPTLSVLGRLALVSCYVKQAPSSSSTTFPDVVHLIEQQQSNNDGHAHMMIVPLSAITSNILLHKFEDTIQAVELWGKGKVLC